jgi:outer membrane murein-binding lipoprotein Lpp
MANPAPTRKTSEAIFEMLSEILEVVTTSNTRIENLAKDVAALSAKIDVLAKDVETIKQARNTNNKQDFAKIDALADSITEMGGSLQLVSETIANLGKQQPKKAIPEKVEPKEEPKEPETQKTDDKGLISWFKKEFAVNPDKYLDMLSEDDKAASTATKEYKQKRTLKTKLDVQAIWLINNSFKDGTELHERLVSIYEKK